MTTLEQNNNLPKQLVCLRPVKTLRKRNNNLDQGCLIIKAKGHKNIKNGYDNALLNSVKTILVHLIHKNVVRMKSRNVQAHFTLTVVVLSERLLTIYAKNLDLNWV